MPTTIPLSTTQPTASAAATAKVKLTSDYNTFIKLLVTQVRNQDPLSPLDTAQYTQQLATFSQVEQAVQSNKLLESISSALGGSSLDRAASLVGRSVEIDTTSGAMRVKSVEIVDGKLVLDLGSHKAALADILRIS